MSDKEYQDIWQEFTIAEMSGVEAIEDEFELIFEDMADDEGRLLGLLRLLETKAEELARQFVYVLSEHYEALFRRVQEVCL